MDFGELALGHDGSSKPSGSAERVNETDIDVGSMSGPSSGGCGGDHLLAIPIDSSTGAKKNCLCLPHDGERKRRGSLLRKKFPKEKDFSVNNKNQRARRPPTYTYENISRFMQRNVKQGEIKRWESL